jgi:hypothetical protein
LFERRTDTHFRPSPISEAVRGNHPHEVQTVFHALPLNVVQFADGSIATLRVLRTQPNLSSVRERASKYRGMYVEFRMVVDTTQILHLNIATEFLFTLTNDCFVKRFPRIDGSSREPPPPLPIGGLQEQHAPGLVGDYRMCAQSVPIVKSHLKSNDERRQRMKPPSMLNEPR